MKAGRLVNVITVQRWNPAGVNPYGTPGGAWVHLATLRAEVLDAAQLEALSARGADDEVGAAFRVRGAVDIAAADRVIFRGRKYVIQSVAEIGRADGLELRCLSPVAEPAG